MAGGAKSLINVVRQSYSPRRVPPHFTRTIRLSHQSQAFRFSYLMLGLIRRCRPNQQIDLRTFVVISVIIFSEQLSHIADTADVRSFEEPAQIHAGT